MVTPSQDSGVVEIDWNSRIQTIGVIRTAVQERRDAPCQPGIQAGYDGHLEIDAAYAEGLADLATFTHIWLIYTFHRNHGYRMKVKPPRGGPKRGLFATRGPHRPSSIGLTVARLNRVDGNRLDLSEIDLLDGTPVLDIKPYLPEVDMKSDASSGWLESQAWVARDILTK